MPLILATVLVALVTAPVLASSAPYPCAIEFVHVAADRVFVRFDKTASWKILEPNGDMLLIGGTSISRATPDGIFSLPSVLVLNDDVTVLLRSHHYGCLITPKLKVRPRRLDGSIGGTLPGLPSSSESFSVPLE